MKRQKVTIDDKRYFNYDCAYKNAWTFAWTFALKKSIYSLAASSLVISCANTRLPMLTLSFGVWNVCFPPCLTIALYVTPE